MDVDCMVLPWQWLIEFGDPSVFVEVDADSLTLISWFDYMKKDCRNYLTTSVNLLACNQYKLAAKWQPVFAFILKFKTLAMYLNYS